MGVGFGGMDGYKFLVVTQHVSLYYKLHTSKVHT